ncbi:Ku protein [Wenxinia marina]|uniref:Non-homologous end joining protein Ku n=1 Tax=Wenxinia marina DSM 24838 TaxID=1123501 RepID=A0A0D0QJV0_9RHOB|nr:Ku protein [Wenxinia marina]KIQ71288.1 Ku protein, prokaryotic [Wenxinia marina DSM 24838]GGL73590.1 non-homologous end joining protein Ku [Wenxinia marina]
MASRAVWKGQLRLSLVSIPVEMHSAHKSGSRVSFRQIHGPSGKKVRYEKTVPGVGPVKAEDILKGYEVGKDEYLLLEPDEIDALKLETKRTLELVQFVGVAEIPPIYFDRPYYLIPSDEMAEEAYRVVRDALRQAQKVGLGQVTMRGKEYLCAIRPCGDGLLLETLHYADEIRNAEPLFSEIGDEASDDELLDVATQLIDRKTGPFEADAFTDHYDAALRKLIEAKRKDKDVPRALTEGEGDRPKGGNVVDLMGALKASLADKDAAPSKSRASSKSSGAKSSGAKSSGTTSSGAKSSASKSSTAKSSASKSSSKSATSKSSTARQKKSA